MNNVHRTRRRWTAVLLRAVFTVAVLALILTQIDLSKLWVHLRGIHPGYYVLGILVSPLYLVTGAFRWMYLTGLGEHRTLPYRFFLKHYVLGMSVGMLMPGSIGSDAYRAAAAGGRYQDYQLQIIVITSEKIAALMTVILTVVLLHPFIDGYLTIDSDVVEDLHSYSAAGLVATCVVLLLALVPRTRRRMGPLIRRSIASYNALAARISENIKSVPGITIDEDRFMSILRKAFHVRTLLIVLALSSMIFSVVALRGQIFLQGMGYDFPILANLYVVPIMGFLLMLPVSFKGFGIREAAFILLYGMFGIPAEAALALSLFSLSAILIVNGVGGVIAAASRVGDSFG